MKKKLLIAASVILVVLGVVFMEPLARRILRPSDMTPPTPPLITPEPLYFPTPTPPPQLVADTLMPVGVFDFPTLRLETAVHPFKVDRDYWHNGTLCVTGANAPFTMAETAVRIRGRGSSTWNLAAEGDKRPLRIRFEEPRTLLDSPHAARDWVLLANLFDMSLVRTHMAFFMAELQEGMDWAPFSRLVHVYINGEYQGVFQIVDERNTEEGRAPLTRHPNPAHSEFLVEKRGLQERREWLPHLGEVEGIDFTFVHRWVIDVRYPRVNDRTPYHMTYVRGFLYRVHDAIMAHDFDAVAALVDLPSLIDFYLLQEWFNNIDVPAFSVFMQIRHAGDERRLYFGPAWDFDRSAGNLHFWYTPQHLYAARYNVWFANLLQIPEFFYLTVARWQALYACHVPRTLAYIQYLLDNYEPALARNFEAHDHILGGDPEWFSFIPAPIREIDTYRGQLEYLIDWMQTRATWLTGYFTHR